MSYKTIVVHVDASRHAQARIEAAAISAAQENAHLVGVATTGVSRSKARRFGSICTGAFVLAHLGLVGGKRVATHWN